MKRLMQALSLAALMVAPALHAEDVYCRITGTQQKLILGNNTVRGLEDTLPVQALAVGLETQANASTGGGKSVGKAIYGPLTLVRSLDAASPKLFMAAATGELLSLVECTFYRKGGKGGAMQSYFKITLGNSVITALNVDKDEQADSSVRESISFSFASIKMEDTITGDEWEDDLTD